MRRILTLVAAVVAIILGGSASAFADCHGDGVDGGSGFVNVGPTTSSQAMSWSLANRQAAVTAQNSDAVVTSYCLDAKFDWITTSGHYDSRTARNCDATGTSIRGDTRQEPAGWDTRAVNGLQKTAGCYYNQTNPPAFSGCNYLAGSVCEWASSQARAWTNMSQAVYLRRENGTTDYNSGGAERFADQ